MNLHCTLVVAAIVAGLRDRPLGNLLRTAGGGDSVRRWHHGAEPDLFGQTPDAPPRSLLGLRTWDAVVTPEQEAELITRIDASELEPFRFQGWLGKRLTRSFGWTYDFDNGRFEQGAPLPEWLLPVREIAATTVGMPSDLFAQALLIRYDPGAGIGWHKDRPVFEHVIGVSLGNAATLRFRRCSEHRFDRFAHQALRADSIIFPVKPRWLGAPHRRNGGSAMVDHLSQYLRAARAGSTLSLVASGTLT